MTNHITVGKTGEHIARTYVEHEGMRILDHNWHCEHGEVDLVARDGHDLVFIEVKTRSSLAAGHPLEAITPKKISRMRRVAFAWLRAHDEVGPVRLDAISVLMCEGRKPSILHIEAIAA